MLIHRRRRRRPRRPPAAAGPPKRQRREGGPPSGATTTNQRLRTTSLPSPPATAAAGMWTGTGAAGAAAAAQAPAVAAGEEVSDFDGSVEIANDYINEIDTNNSEIFSSNEKYIIAKILYSMLHLMGTPPNPPLPAKGGGPPRVANPRAPLTRVKE